MKLKVRGAARAIPAGSSVTRATTEEKMSTADPSAAAVGFDFERLLAPVSEENPVGADLRQVTVDGKSMLLADIEDKRKLIIGGKNEILEPQEGRVDAAAVASALAQQRKKEWREVEKMLIDAFAKGKELGAAVSLAQAAVISRGWAALGPSLRFIRVIQERFSDSLYPMPETDERGKDFTNRLVLLERLDHENFLPLAIGQLPITDPRTGGEFSWADHRQLQILRQSRPAKNEDPEARRQMIEERARAFEDAVAKSTPAYYRSLLNTMQNASAELEALRSFVERYYAGAPEDERPTFRRTAEALEECRSLAAQCLRKTGGEQASAAPDSAAPDSGETAATGEIPAAAGTRVAAAASDRDVVQLLEAALAYLRLHQRHNPAAFLVEEAIRWTKMPIGSWYLEASEDTSMSGFISKLMRRGGSAGSP